MTRRGRTDVHGDVKMEACESDDVYLQVIILGSGGGPCEDNTTSLLVRSMSSGWKRGSMLAVDAGTHLSTLTRMLAENPTPADQTSRPHEITKGPFQGFMLPYTSAAANAAYLTTRLIDTYLITHPHLDHISAFVINTVIPTSRPKRLAGLPSTIEAFKTHIFNNVIWPNLSDENNGAGLVTYMRLVEGGSPALGDGDARGYFEVCEGLGVKIWGVSHGHCVEKHSHRGSGSTLSLDIGHESPRGQSSRRLSTDILPGLVAPQMCVVESSAYFIRDVISAREVLIFGDVEPDSISLSPRNILIWREAAPRIVARKLRAIFIECSYDDSQSEDTLFGHLAPRYLIEELKALAAEVKTVRTELDRDESTSPYDTRKRKRCDTLQPFATTLRRKSPRSNGISQSPKANPKKATISPARPASRSRSGRRTAIAEVSSIQEERNGESKGATWSSTADGSDGTALASDEAVNVTICRKEVLHGQLSGLKVVIIHAKEKLDDGPDRGHVILQQLREYEAMAQLGCEFLVSKSGMAVYV